MANRTIAFVIPPMPGRDIPDPSGLPLGPLYLAASLPEGWRAALIDGYSAHLAAQQVINEIADAQPDMVAISLLFSPQAACLSELCAGVESRLPNAAIIAGGPHVSFLPERTLADSPELDCLVLGEGEMVLKELLATFPMEGAAAQWRIPAELKGLAFRQAGELIHTGMADLANDLDMLPAPDYGLISNPDEYSPRIITSRGCPHRCIFCSAANYWGRRWRAHSPERVLDEIERTLSAFGNRPISFGDDNFTVSRDRTAEICEGILSRGLNIHFGISAHPDNLDCELIQILAKAGMDSLFLGIESGVSRMREAIGKDFDEDNLLKTLSACNDTSIQVHASFMLGIPGENESDMQATLAFAESLPVASLGFHIFNPLPGSAIASEPDKYGFQVLSDEYADMAIEARCRIRTPSLHPLAVLDYYYRGRAIAAGLGKRGTSAG